MTTNAPISFEFFPTKTEAGHEKLLATAQTLAAAGPEFFSVTYGAGGSTRDGTRRTVLQLDGEVKVPTAPHLSCVGDSRDDLRSLINDYRANGIQRIGCLAHAASESLQLFPELSAEIRRHWKLYEVDEDNYEVPTVELLKKVEELLAGVREKDAAEHAQMMAEHLSGHSPAPMPGQADPAPVAGSLPAITEAPEGASGRGGTKLTLREANEMRRGDAGGPATYEGQDGDPGDQKDYASDGG